MSRANAFLASLSNKYRFSNILARNPLVVSTDSAESPDLTRLRHGLASIGHGAATLLQRSSRDDASRARTSIDCSLYESLAPSD